MKPKKRRKYAKRIRPDIVSSGKRFSLYLMPNDTVLLRQSVVQTGAIVKEINSKKNQMSLEQMAYLFERLAARHTGQPVTAYRT